MINHSSENATLAARQHHRVLSNSSAADVRPPEGVPVFLLDAVVMSMDILELIPRRNTSTAKRLKTSTTSNNMSPSKNSQDTDGLCHEPTDAFPLASNATIPLLSPSTPKIPRSLALLAERPATSPMTPPYEAIYVSQPKMQACNVEVETQASGTGVEPPTMQTLIDGALRLSILSSINSKMLPGIKIKANTFGYGLADIAPTLWKPSYLSSLSQRANLLPTISRSLRQSEATVSTASVSLKRKLSSLAAQLPSLQHIDGREHADALDGSRLVPSVAPQLWLHLQKHTPCKAATSLRSFITAEPQSTPLPDDMLEEPWQETGETRRSRPSSVGPDGGRASGFDQAIEGCPAATATCDGLPSELHLLGAVTTRDSSKNDDDELLLGAECFDDPNFVAFRGSELA
ncbi:uncharacterized protein M421DRAFT_154993 [Didymella exigua CBS 183.55]|uniref:Uncharacterized protein n=1 Tax=Didymella exigua CBS 183.55 TaxID=1150837 RepID=A0A6A5RMX1_9PLEO|nr:uncharacterized protein M421DRAFT_154993 [Didymella exigua CBS 183.55]KAF1928783.1 hypothetical protein M421DRAFT_154993 [Didymella exigua CBS 183.55]